MKPTLQNIARLAGVGTATAERVLNGRGGVRPALVENVANAARSLDYPKRLPDLHRGIVRIDVLLMRPETTFYDPTIAVHRTFLDEQDPLRIAEWIARPEGRRAGLIVAAPDQPEVRAALHSVEAEGVPIIQIVTRTASVEASYVGIDNYAAGRSAGLFTSSMQPRNGTVVALCHSQIYQVHRGRIRGFSDYFAEHPRGGMEFAAVLFAQDEAIRSAEMLAEALKAWPDLVGLYNAGGANSSLASVLHKHPRGRDIFFVGHILAVKWRDFLLHAFDPAQAKAVGLRVNWLHYGLLAILSLTIVGALKAVGLILAIAMLIAPGAIAFLITRTMGSMLIAAVLVAVVASFTGVYVSFFIDSAPAPTIVLLMTAMFVIAIAWSSWRTARMEAQRTIVE